MPRRRAPPDPFPFRHWGHFHVEDVVEEHPEAEEEGASYDRPPGTDAHPGQHGRSSQAPEEAVRPRAREEGGIGLIKAHCRIILRQTPAHRKT